MQKFAQNKNSTTIAKRTIINFKKSKSIAKSINVNINNKQEDKGLEQHNLQKSKLNLVDVAHTQTALTKNPEQKKEFRTKIQLKGFNNKVTNYTDRPKLRKYPLNQEIKSESFIVEKFNKQNIFKTDDKNNFKQSSLLKFSNNNKYESIPKKPARKLNTPLKKFINYNEIQKKSHQNPQDQVLLLNTRKSKVQVQGKKQRKIIQKKQIQKYEKRSKQSEKKQILASNLKQLKIQSQQKEHLNEQNNQILVSLSSQRDHLQNGQVIFSRTNQNNIANLHMSSRQIVNNQNRIRQSRQSIPVQIYQTFNGRQFHFPLGPTRRINQQSHNQRRPSPTQIRHQLQEQEQEQLLQNISQNLVNQSHISQNLNYAQRMNQIHSLQEVRENEIERLVEISQQNSVRQESIDIQELIRNTSDIIAFISRLNIRNDQTFSMMVAQLTQLNTIAQQVNELGELGSRLGYSLVNVFGVRIRQLQTSIVNQVGLALIRNFQQRIDPQFQSLILRQPALKIGFTKNQISQHFQQRVNMIQSECSICLQEVQSGALTIQLQCRHQFHSKCIAHWLQSSKKCPLCRHEQKINKN